MQMTSQTVRRSALATVLGLTILGGPTAYQYLTTTTPQLAPGQRLTADQEVQGAGAVLRYQGDGNLVLYGRSGPLWASNTSAAPGYVEMQGDGNLVAYNAAGAPYWATDTHAPGAWAEISAAGLRLKAVETVWSTPAFPVDPGPERSPFARVGYLRAEPAGFVDDSGFVLPLYAHAGNLFSLFTRDPGRAIAELDDVAAAGYQGVRVWSTLGGSYWAGDHVGPDITPHYWEHVRAFGEALRARGLRAVWSQGDVGQLRERRAYMTRLAELDAALGGFIDFIDCGNEAWQTGEPDPARLAQCVGYYQSAGGRAIRSLTSPAGETKEVLDAFSIDPAQVYDVHSDRGQHFWDKRRHIFSIPYEGKPRRRLGINSEPPGAGRLVSATANIGELNHEAVTMLAVAGAISRQAWVWFSGEGVKIDRGLKTEAGFATTPTAFSWLPRDLMTYQTLHHGGNTWRGTRFVATVGEARVDCATTTTGDKAVCTIDGPPGTYRFPVEKSFTGRLCHPGDGTCQDVAYQAGQSMPVSFERGRVLLIP